MNENSCIYITTASGLVRMVGYDTFLLQPERLTEGSSASQYDRLTAFSLSAEKRIRMEKHGN